MAQGPDTQGEQFHEQTFAKVDSILPTIKSAVENVAPFPEQLTTPLALSTYAHLTLHPDIPVEFQERVLMRSAAFLTAAERRNMPLESLLASVQTTIVSPTEPSHREALDRYGIFVTPITTNETTAWHITLPATLSSESQGSMLSTLQQLGVLPEASAGAVVLPMYVRVIMPIPTIPSRGKRGKEIQNAKSMLQKMLDRAYGSFSTQEQITDQSMVLGTYRFISDDIAHNINVIHSNQVLGSMFLEWMQQKLHPRARRSPWREGFAEPFGVLLLDAEELFQNETPSNPVSLVKMQEILHDERNAAEDFLYPSK